MCESAQCALPSCTPQTHAWRLTVWNEQLVQFCVHCGVFITLEDREVLYEKA